MDGVRIPRSDTWALMLVELSQLAQRMGLATWSAIAAFHAAASSR